MANPQLENGFTRIANEILEAICKIKVPPTQFKIILVILRSTYGFNKKSHDLSLTYISNATNCDRRSIQRHLNDLEKKRIIFQDTSSKKTRVISFNKNYEEWLNVGGLAVGNLDIGNSAVGNSAVGSLANSDVGSLANSDVGSLANQKRNNKEIYKEKIKRGSLDSFDAFWSEYPKKVGKKPAFQKYKTVIKKHDPEIILEGVKRYKQYCEAKGISYDFIQHPKTFLNQEAFLDYQPEREEKEKEKIVDPQLERKKRIDYLNGCLNLGLSYFKRRGMEEEYYKYKEEYEKLEQL